jgi:hypothetical protein
LYFKDVNWEDVYQRYFNWNNIRKLEPPKPICKNKVIEQYSKPRILQDCIFYENEKDEGKRETNYFDNWSFVKNSPDNK